MVLKKFQPNFLWASFNHTSSGLIKSYLWQKTLRDISSLAEALP